MQNQSLDAGIRSKMLGDLNKAISLKRDGAWVVEAWTFICNYPIPESIAREVLSAGEVAGIAVSWRGAADLASVLQKAKDVADLFPNLQQNEVMDRLNTITSILEAQSQLVEAPVTWVPRNEAETENLLAAKPPCWEYLLFAGLLMQGRQVLEPKWLDYRSGYAPRKGVYLAEDEVILYLRGIFEDADAIVTLIEAAFSPENHDLAFGKPGEEGNAMLIEHLAKRVLTAYEELLDWEARIRGTVFPDNFRRAFELVALVIERPATELRDFIDYTVAQIEPVPDLVAQGENVSIELPLVLTSDQAAFQEFDEEMLRIQANSQPD